MPERDRWRQVDVIFHAALEQPREQLPAFLAQACAGDEGLRHEVESLLAHDRDAGAFLRGHALGAAPRDAEHPGRSLVGQVLGSYQVIGRIGSGGMGEVYAAQDTRLGRRVALKMIARELSQDARWKARFVQEAKAVSALNHPNIVTMHDIGTEDGRDFLVMEYVDGKTLEEVIGARPMPVDEALGIAEQIAGALAAAHTLGIVHRDLKPANVMVTPAGLAKVLDFGLAKLPRREESARTAAARTGARGGTVSA
jgi:serine/threonine protein kinase